MLMNKIKTSQERKPEKGGRVIPTLYEKTEREFRSNGLGRLADAITCKVTEERNGIYELEMTYPVTGIHYDRITMERIIFATPSDGKSRQAFRIYKITKPMNGVVTILARHISYQLSFIPVKTDMMAANAASVALMQLKADALEECPFDFWTDVDTNATYNTMEAASLRSRLGGTSGSILDTFGGEYEWDNWTVKLWKARGEDKGISILYGKNLTDLKQEESIENVVTGIYPFWRKEEDGKVEEVALSAPVYAPNAERYPFKRTVVMDFSQEWQDKPTEAQLRARTESYIRANKPEVPDVNLTISFVALWQTEEYKNVAPLERVNLCDTITIRFPTLGVDAKAKVIKTVYDCLKDRYESIEVGTARTNLSDVIAGNKEEAEARSKQTESFLKAAINQASKLIQGGLGGHVVFGLDGDGKPNEILIMDTDDMNTAVHVIRMNMAGIGFSDSGYDGPFKTAWTIDSKFVADFITTGTLRAGLIKAGVLSDKSGKNFWNMETGDFQLSATTQVGDSTVASQDDIDEVKGSAIQAVDVEYAQADSQTEPPEDGWQTNAPKWEEGKFIWQRTVTTMADGTVAYSKALCITGIKGEAGKDAILLIIDSTNGNLFKNSEIATILNVSVITGDLIITDSKALKEYFGETAHLIWSAKQMGEKEWTPVSDTDSRLNDEGFLFTINPKDIDTKCQFQCELDV